MRSASTSQAPETICDEKGVQGGGEMERWREESIDSHAVSQQRKSDVGRGKTRTQKKQEAGKLGITRETRSAYRHHDR